MKDLVRAVWLPSSLLGLLIIGLFTYGEMTNGRDSQHVETQAMVKENAERLERIEAELAKRRIELNAMRKVQQEHAAELKLGRLPPPPKEGKP